MGEFCPQESANMEENKKMPRAYSTLIKGARTIQIMPSVRGTEKHISKGGIAGDWRKVGGDIRNSMSRLERERA